MSDKKILPAFILVFLFGVFGVHRFYVGKWKTGILQIITFGGLGIWALIDLIVIVIGKFTDKDGKTLSQWT
jgi:TM2 domain-containing membrane protein YozV